MRDQHGNIRRSRLASQIGFYLCVGLLIGYFSSMPAYQYSDGNVSLLKLVVRHSGDLLGECKILDQEDLDKLPPNMRRAEVCPREKAKMKVTLELDNATVFNDILTPSGIHNDGVLALYHQVKLQPGSVKVKMIVQSGDHDAKVLERRIEINPAEVILLEYHDAGFSLIRTGGGDV